jgi:hypothetical protein
MEQEQTPPKKKKQSLTDFGKYSGMGLQMAAIMAAGVLSGHWLDGLTGIKFPIFTLVLAMAGVFLALWYFIKDFLKKK